VLAHQNIAGAIAELSARHERHRRLRHRAPGAEWRDSRFDDGHTAVPGLRDERSLGVLGCGRHRTRNNRRHHQEILGELGEWKSAFAMDRADLPWRTLPARWDGNGFLRERREATRSHLREWSQDWHGNVLVSRRQKTLELGAR